jgi:DNA-binding NtrC family response regulator
MLGATFTHAGYRAVMASDGEEALLILGARLKEIFLVVTDLDMPRMGGEALARAIRVINPAMKILVMSGISDRYSRESPCDFASAFLQKPFTVDVLLHQVQRLLHGSGSRPPLLPALGFRPGSPAETTGKP